ncbi:MAG: helix-turn-helix domain-containing protein [Porticoccaceae bacterium]
MDNDKTIAQQARDVFSCNFEHYLAARGKTQTEVAEHLHVSTATVSDWVNGKKYPRVDKMQRLADYLGVLISDLRDEKLPPTEAEGEAAEIIQLYDAAPPEMKRAALEFLRAASRLPKEEVN